MAFKGENCWNLSCLIYLPIVYRSLKKRSAECVYKSDMNDSYLENHNKVIKISSVLLGKDRI